MKKIEIALAAAFALCFLGALAQASFSARCARVRDDTLRLHIVANSDSGEDQRVKLLVRDALLGQVAALTDGCADKAAAVGAADRACASLAATAQAVLRANGLGYGASAKITEMYFDERVYGDVTLPAGVYTALRVELGEAKGYNWWCVLYPAVCFAASSERQLAGYDGAEIDLVTGGQRYALRFKVEAWLRQREAEGR